eukprot:3569908-Rhodomonas_salina.1
MRRPGTRDGRAHSERVVAVSHPVLLLDARASQPPCLAARRSRSREMMCGPDTAGAGGAASTQSAASSTSRENPPSVSTS